MCFVREEVRLDDNGAGAQDGDVLLTLREIPANIKAIPR